MSFLKGTRLFLKSLTDLTVLDELDKTNPNGKYEEKPVEKTYITRPSFIKVRRLYLQDDGIKKYTKQISEYNRKIAKGFNSNKNGKADESYKADPLTEEERTEYNHLRDELKDFLKVEKFLKIQLESDECDLICSESNENILKYLDAKEKLGPGKELKTDAFLTGKHLDLRKKLESQNSEKKK